jgi:hypothetical protein
LAPGADPRQIKLQFDGAEQVTLDAGGNLVLKTASGDLVSRLRRFIRKPRARGKRSPGAYVLHGEREVGFEIGACDASRPLVIDPVLRYLTYLGGSLGR